MVTKNSFQTSSIVQLVKTFWPQKLELLTYERYWRFGIISSPQRYAFCKNMGCIPLGSAEFIQASANYPIVFLDDDNQMPHAIVGLTPYINLMVNSKGAWRPGYYIPQKLQLYPFGVTEISKSQAENMFLDSFLSMEDITTPHQKNFLSIDASSPLLVALQNEPTATPMFLQDGSVTPLIKQNIELQSLIKADQDKTASFVNALRSHKVLASRTINLHFKNDVSTVSIGGFSTISQSALSHLSPSTKERWQELGYMDLIERMTQSQKKWGHLIPLHERRMKRDLAALKVQKS